MSTPRLRSPEGVALLAGNGSPEGATPVAQAYAATSSACTCPRLGDGRALLLGEVVDVHGRRRDLHLKGSGRTPFARGGDGKAAVGPDAARVPDRRGDARPGHPDHAGARGRRYGRAGRAGDDAAGRGAEPASRRATCGSARSSTPPRPATATCCAALADHAIARHHPEAAGAEQPVPGALSRRVVEAQASLVARWMLVGFVHGVMNTDNMTISGETIDYGPCAFMDAYDPATVFSSIDHGGRYAYGNQPAIAQWNLARLAETLLPLIDDDADAAVAAATEVLEAFADAYRHLGGGHAAKLGLPGAATPALVDGPAGPDAGAGRRLHAVLPRCSRPAPRGPCSPSPALRRVGRPPRGVLPADRAAVAAAMDRVNPVYIPRNHLVEEALPPPPMATSTRSAGCSPSSPLRSRSGPALTLRPARPRGLRPVRHVLRHLTTDPVRTWAGLARVIGDSSTKPDETAAPGTGTAITHIPASPARCPAQIRPRLRVCPPRTLIFSDLARAPRGAGAPSAGDRGPRRERRRRTGFAGARRR